MAVKKRASKAERKHMARVAALGCIICRRPAECHHPRTGIGAARRSSHFDVIPLCPEHHRLGKRGVAIHAGKRSFEANFGSEFTLLEKTRGLLLEAGETGRLDFDL